MRLRRIVMPETAKPGETINIRALIAHPMFRGYSRSPENSRPRRIIHTFSVHFDDREIFRTELFPGIAANPVFEVRVTATRTGEFRFTWTEDGGKQAVETRTLTVTPS